MSNRDNSGVLFRNNRKEKESQPDHTGKLDAVLCPHCQKYTDWRVSAWIKEGPKAGRFFSLSITPQDEVPKQSKPAAPPPVPANDFDDDVPF